MLRTLSLILVASTLMIGGCVGTYGGRTVTRGELMLIYDPGIHVYVVQSYPDTYYSSQSYYRYSSGIWVRSRTVNGPWERCSHGELPSGLRDRWGHHEDRRHGHHRGRY
jgi:hypothetical protein